MLARPGAESQEAEHQLDHLHQCLDNIRALIEEAGGVVTGIVKYTVYVTDRVHWQPMNDVYFANFKDDPPHRVSCIVSGLGALECLVEIDATAYLGKD